MSFLKKIASGKLGWKTITGAILIALSVVLESIGLITPDQAQAIVRAGEALGIVGLRDAIAKIPDIPFNR